MDNGQFSPVNSAVFLSVLCVRVFAKRGGRRDLRGVRKEREPTRDKRHVPFVKV